MKRCPLCGALERIATIDDIEAERILTSSDMSTWCSGHMRAWLDERADATHGRAKLEAILKRAGRAL